MTGLTIGSVEAVAPDEIRVALEFDAPQATALNTGQPSRFPRLNGFVLIPNETGALVGLVTWLGIEKSPYPKRPGLSDFGLVDLPFPLRKLLLNPVATLRSRGPDEARGYELERGVAVFPSVGDSVVLPSAEQLKAIVESEGPNRRVRIGTSPLAANAIVSVDPDKIFGRHLAVLGNTGSGKSCSVAGLVRWSLLAATSERRESRSPAPNARFLILDPNGEYLDTFQDLGNAVRVFQASLDDAHREAAGFERLTVPAWLWNSHEWCAFTQAAPGVQRPLLVRGLRELRAGAGIVEDPAASVARVLRSYRAWLDRLLSSGPAYYGESYPGRMSTGGFLRNLQTDALAHATKAPSHANELAALAQQASIVAQAHAYESRGGTGYNAFSDAELTALANAVDALLERLPEPGRGYLASEDAPAQFAVEALADYLELLAKGEDFAQGAQHIPMLLTRIRTLMTDPRLGPIVNPPDPPSLAAWIEGYLGADQAQNGQIAVIDLSLVPSDVLHVAVAVIARLVFEACQRFRKMTGQELPTTLVLEVAHSFIRRASTPDAAEAASTVICRETFERIAREGRKFGLGLVLSSQRPSELSATVLAQCNTFLLHRIVNDRDQELVARLVPDKLGGLLRDLPSLPSRQAILLGWATPVPVLVEIAELPVEHRPRSEDPRFWDVWTGAEERTVDWTAIADDWTRTS